MQEFKASMIASMSCVVVFSPMEVARTRLSISAQSLGQVVRSIYRADGIKGFYRGLVMSASTTPLCTSLYLGIYQKTQEIMRTNVSSPAAASMCASVVTGAVCNTLTNPLWLLKTRIQASNQRLLQVWNDIYKKEGLKGYYRGLTMSYLGLAHFAVYFPLYEGIKENLALGNANNILIASSLAKFVAILVTYPNTLLLTKLHSAVERLPLLHIANHTYKAHGIQGLFSGIQLEIGRSLPANALTFLLYETLKSSNTSTPSLI